MSFVDLTIDGATISAEKGRNLIDVAKEHGIYIPTLCYFKDMGTCLGTCRICTIKWKRHFVSACVLKVEEGMILSVHTPELANLRKGLVELMFVEGNHFCPSCEKSGDCILQALGYRLKMFVSRFHYRFNNRPIQFNAKKIIFEHNRCVLCKRCTHKFVDDEGKRVFYFKGKGSHLQVQMDEQRVNLLSDEKVSELERLCPVGAILKKGKGFDRPYGSRAYDHHPIGSELEEQNES